MQVRRNIRASDHIFPLIYIETTGETSKATRKIRFQRIWYATNMLASYVFLRIRYDRRSLISLIGFLIIGTWLLLGKIKGTWLFLAWIVLPSLPFFRHFLDLMLLLFIFSLTLSTWRSVSYSLSLLLSLLQSPLQLSSSLSVLRFLRLSNSVSQLTMCSVSGTGWVADIQFVPLWVSMYI